MKIEILKSNLDKAVSIVSRVSNKNLSLPVLGCVVIVAKNDRVVLKATNLDVSVEILIKGKVFEEGIVAVPAHVLAQTISTATDEKFTLSGNETTLIIKGLNGSAQIKTIDNTEFPTLPFIKEGEGVSITLPTKEFSRALKAVSFAASNSGMRPELSSVYMEVSGGVMTTAATDSFRLAEMKTPIKVKSTVEPVLIPQRNIPDIIRILESGDTTEVRFGDGQLSILVDGSYLTSRTIDGAFPEYQAIIPREFTTKATILTEDALKVFRKVSVFVDSTNQVTLTIEDKKFSVEAKNTHIGETKEDIDSVVEGDSISINFNIRYISEALNVITADSIVFNIAGIGKPMVITDVPDKGFSYLVMPMNK